MKKFSLKLSILYISMLQAINLGISSVFKARLSFLIAQDNIGDAATTGIITTFTSVGGSLAGILYGKLSQIINRQVITSVSAVSIHRDFVMAIFMSSISLGMSAAPIFTSLLSFILPAVTNRRIYFITAALLLIYSIMSLAFNLKHRKNVYSPKVKLRKPCMIFSKCVN